MDKTTAEIVADIRALISKAAKATSASEANNYAQAACTSATALQRMHEVISK